MKEYATSKAEVRHATELGLHYLIKARDAFQTIDEDYRPIAINGAIIDALLDVMIDDLLRSMAAPLR